MLRGAILSLMSDIATASVNTFNAQTVEANTKYLDRFLAKRLARLEREDQKNTVKRELFPVA
jgi:hypothetical protein